MWRKKLIQKESGTTQGHHYGAAARAIQAERSRKVAMEQMETRAAKTAAANAENADSAEACHGGLLQLTPRRKLPHALPRRGKLRRILRWRFQNPEK